MAIPGVTTIIKDRFFTVSRQDAPAGPRIVAIAKRSTADGTAGITDLDVYRATNESDVISAFGEDSPIHRAFVELVTAGAERVFLVPLPSDTVFNDATGAVTSATAGGDVFEAAFKAAEAAVPDIIVPWGRGSNNTEWAATPGDTEEYGFYADNTTTTSSNWTLKVAQEVRAISEATNPCLAVMGIKPYASASERMTPGQVNTHLSLPNLPNRDAGTAFKDAGPYVAVVATEVKPVNFKYGYSNGAAFLAATLSRLASYSSLINKPVYSIESIRYAPTRTQQGALGDKGVNTIVVNFNKIPVFADSLTFAQSTSDYTRITTKRIVDEAALVVRQACSKFIGEPSNIQVRNAMETAITSGLRGMQLVGALLGSDFTVTYIPNQNKAIVDLALTPAFELKTIEVQIAINL